MAEGGQLVGRDRELAVIHDALSRTAAGRAARLVVLGEPGIGKTRLLQAAAEDARGFGLRTLSGTAIESGHGLPFLPLLVPLAHAVDPRANDPAAIAVRRLVSGAGPPHAEDAAGDTGHSVSDVGSAARLVESIFAVLARRPTALIVDDVHWADASTLMVLDHLAERARDVPLAIIVAARDDEAEWLVRASFADGRRFALLPVPRLDRAQIASQLTAIRGVEPDRELVDAVDRRSAGNPLFVEQLAAGDVAAAVTGELPLTLRRLVDRRVVLMARPTRDVLDALAVLGHAGHVDMIATVAGVDADVVSGALDEAARRGVVATCPAGTDFRHPLFREVIIGGLDPGRAAALHARAADMLEAVGATAAEIAAHRWLGTDRQAAWAAALAAGDEAEGALAFAEARVHLEHAIEAWPDSEGGLAQVGARAARAAWIAGDAHGAMVIARAVAERVSPDVALLNAVGTYEWDAGERPASIRTFERVASLLGASVPPVDRGRALWGLGRARVAVGRYDEAAAAALQAAAVAADAGAPGREAESRMLFAMARAFTGSFEGIEPLRTALLLSERAGSPSVLGQATQFLTDLLETSGDLDGALAVARTGIERCEPLGQAGFHGADLRGRAALILLDLGRWDEAAEIVEPANTRAYPSLARALLAIRRGRDDVARSLLEAAAAGGAIGGPGSLSGWLELARVEAAWTRGDEEAARMELHLVPPMQGIWARTLDGRTGWWSARLHPDRDSTDLQGAALGVPEAGLGAAIAADIRAVSLTFDRGRHGSQAAAPAAAADAWTASVEAWTAAGRPYEQAHALRLEATARFACGDRDAARAALHAASEIAERLGAAPLAEQVADLARRARVRARAPRRNAPDPDALTSREIDVLRLLADGLTNRRIAEDLYLSPKTVGIHVTRILGKLGAHTRGEAVAEARRRAIIA
jgi:DNA-binding NarL/FixJ family response regulator